MCIIPSCIRSLGRTVGLRRPFSLKIKRRYFQFSNTDYVRLSSLRLTRNVINVYTCRVFPPTPLFLISQTLRLDACALLCPLAFATAAWCQSHLVQIHRRSRHREARGKQKKTQPDSVNRSDGMRMIMVLRSSEEFEKMFCQRVYS